MKDNCQITVAALASLALGVISMAIAIGTASAQGTGLDVPWFLQQRADEVIE